MKYYLEYYTPRRGKKRIDCETYDDAIEFLHKKKNVEVCVYEADTHKLVIERYKKLIKKIHKWYYWFADKGDD